MITKLEMRARVQRWHLPVSMTVLTCGLFPVAALTQSADGTLDRTFGDGGVVITDFGGTSDQPEAMALQPDGKMVVAGAASSVGKVTIALARYNPDGSLDPTFGVGGRVITDLADTPYEAACAVVIQRDGKIIIAGDGTRASVTDWDRADFVLVRYETNGSLDTGFGTGGVVFTDFGSTFDIAFAIALQDDGKIVVAGAAQRNGPRDIALARYQPDGSLDPSFDGDGRVLTAVTPDYDAAFDIAIQRNGRIVVAGGAGDRGEDTTGDFALVGYASDGTLDPTFGVDGVVMTDLFGYYEVITGMTLTPDDKIVVVGLMLDADGTSAALARYDANGAIDTTFGTGGVVQTDFPNARTEDMRKIALQPDGRIVAAGVVLHPARPGVIDLGLARYMPDGTLDVTFGVGGLLTTDIDGLSNAGSDLVIQPDGGIVAMGLSGRGRTGPSDFTVVRYRNPPSVGTHTRPTP